MLLHFPRPRQNGKEVGRWLRTAYEILDEKKEKHITEHDQHVIAARDRMHSAHSFLSLHL